MKIPKIPGWLVGLSVVGSGYGLVILYRDSVKGNQFKEDVRIPGKTVVITGANSGLGKATAHELAKRGGKIIMACRDLSKCEEARREIVEATFNKAVSCKRLDLASVESIQEFANDFNKNEKRLDILINNAGVMGLKDHKVTADGFEYQLGVNHLGHFLLTNLLLDKLKMSSPSRIINITSSSHKRAILNWDDLNSFNEYQRDLAYYQSKLANILHIKELAKRLEGTGVSVYAVNPGVCKTNIGRNLNTGVSQAMSSPVLSLLLKTPEQGIQTILTCALDEELEKESGHYYEECCESNDLSDSALSERNALRLWLISEKWTNSRLDDINSQFSKGNTGTKHSEM